jgi:dephospho-CoA kinase
MTIGVTGGIGSGKSTVCAMFGEWGAELVDADRVGHAALEDPTVKAALVDTFGNDIIREDDTLDRRALGQRAFVSDETRLQLTDIVWPEIGRRLKETVSDAKSKGTEFLVVEASVLLERGDPEKIYETIVVVTAPESDRVERTMARLGISEPEVKDRMRHQMTDEEKIKRADHVIVNDAGMDVLKVRAREVWGALTGKGPEE